MALFVFLGYLASGLLGSLALVRLGAAQRQFFLFNGALALALGLASLLLRQLGPDLWGAPEGLRPAAAAAILQAASLTLLALYLLLQTLAPRADESRQRRSLLGAAALAGVAAVLVDARALHAGHLGAPAHHVLGAFTSAWLSGSILLAMILGHFYLVFPGLGIEPLRSLFRLSLAGLAARILVVSAATWMWWGAAPGGGATIAWALDQGVFVAQRLLFGLAIPASLAWFTWKTIEMRSTQSATGILYVVVFLTLVGEALSVYLSLETRYPL